MGLPCMLVAQLSDIVSDAAASDIKESPVVAHHHCLLAAWNELPGCTQCAQSSSGHIAAGLQPAEHQRYAVGRRVSHDQPAPT
jgi:hypothetical protein